MKRIFYILITFLLFLFILDKLTLLFVRKGNGYGTDVLDFYAQKNNSIDIVFLGSSHTYSSFNPYIIEDKTNLNGYDFATQQQPIWITYFYLKELLKYQDPKYVIIDVHMLVSMNSDYAYEQVNRDAIDKMRFSLNKISMINKCVKKDERAAYYFNIIKYHSRYKELSDNDYDTIFKGRTVNNKGYIALKYKNRSFNYDEIGINNDIIEIGKKSEVYLDKIISLSKNKNYKLIFVKTPAIYSDVEYSKLNYINKYLTDRGETFIDFVKKNDELDLDYKKDFYDSGHLDKEGSEKFSNYFVKYLKEE